MVLMTFDKVAKKIITRVNNVMAVKRMLAAMTLIKLSDNTGKNKGRKLC